MNKHGCAISMLYEILNFQEITKQIFLCYCWLLYFVILNHNLYTNQNKFVVVVHKKLQCKNDEMIIQFSQFTKQRFIMILFRPPRHCGNVEMSDVRMHFYSINLHVVQITCQS